MAKKTPSPKCTWNRHKWQPRQDDPIEGTILKECVFCNQTKVFKLKEGDLNESDEQDSA